MRTRIRSFVAVLPLAVVLALTACGSTDEDDAGNGDDVASADDSSTPDGDSEGDGNSGEPGEALTDEELHDKLLEYAQCLRDQGLDVEDPAPGEGIQIRVEGDPSKSDAALEACEHLSPPPPPGEDEGEEREDMLAYAQCMRDNGVEKFKDPAPGEGINIGPEVVEDPDFESAEEICNELFFGGQPDTQESDA